MSSGTFVGDIRRTSGFGAKSTVRVERMPSFGAGFFTNLGGYFDAKDRKSEKASSSLLALYL